MRRRDLITFIGGAVAWPVTAGAQKSPTPVIGFLSPSSPEAPADRLRAFHQGLKETGYVEGLNVAIEYRWAHEQFDRLPALAADLVQRQVAVIVTSSNPPAALAAKAATATIPIVFAMGGDPVQVGLVDSLNEPGGNVTGVTSMGVDVAGKRLGLLQELLPGATRFAVLVNANEPRADSMILEAQAAGAAIGRRLEASPPTPVAISRPPLRALCESGLRRCLSLPPACTSLAACNSLHWRHAMGYPQAIRRASLLKSVAS